MDSNKRRTRSSSRKKPPLKVLEQKEKEEAQSTAKLSEENKDKTDGSPNRTENSSPEPNCSICLGHLQNKSFTDSCFHMFCFVCIQEWSKVKAECPLCKQKFTSIIHNVRSYEDYDQYPIPQKPPAWEDSEGRNFRYRTTLTFERSLMIGPGYPPQQHHEHDYTLQRPTQTMTTRSNWRQRRQRATTDFRRRIYINGLRVTEAQNGRLRTRIITPEFFRHNDACSHRLVPWLNRELNALLYNHHEHVQFVLEFILGIIKNYPINSEEFYQHVYPYVGRHTRHFMHEFESFAKSPYNMAVYDQHALYQPHTVTVESDSDVESISSDSGEGNDDDIIVISPTQQNQTSEPSEPRAPLPATNSDSTSNYAQHGSDDNTITYDDLSPLLNRVRNFLSADMLSSHGTATSGWDSPTPGPSWLIDNEVSAAEQSSIEQHLPPELRTPKPIKTETVTTSKPRDSGSESSSNSDFDSDSTDGSDVMFVGYDKPWKERSPIVLSSDSDSFVPVEKQKSKYYKKSSSRSDHRDRRRDRSRSRHREDYSKSRRSYDRGLSHSRRYRSRSRSRSLSRRDKRHDRRRERSRSRHRSRGRYRSSSREDFFSRHRSQPFSKERSRSHTSSNNRYSSSHQRKRHRSRSDSIEIMDYQRSKHRRKEKRSHHRKHKHKKHKKQTRHSSPQERAAVQLKSRVVIVDKLPDLELENVSSESEEGEIIDVVSHSDMDKKKPSAPSLNDVSAKSYQNCNNTENFTKSDNDIEDNAPKKSNDVVQSKDRESPQNDVITDTSESACATAENLQSKPYKKHPSGHKKSTSKASLEQDGSEDDSIKPSTNSSDSNINDQTVAKLIELREEDKREKDVMPSGVTSESPESPECDVSTGNLSGNDEIRNSVVTQKTIKSSPDGKDFSDRSDTENSCEINVVDSSPCNEGTPEDKKGARRNSHESNRTEEQGASSGTNISCCDETFNRDAQKNDPSTNSGNVSRDSSKESIDYLEILGEDEKDLDVCITSSSKNPFFHNTVASSNTSSFSMTNRTVDWYRKNFASKLQSSKEKSSSDEVKRVNVQSDSDNEFDAVESQPRRSLFPSLEHLSRHFMQPYSFKPFDMLMNSGEKQTPIEIDESSNSDNSDVEVGDMSCYYSAAGSSRESGARPARSCVIVPPSRSYGTANTGSTKACPVVLHSDADNSSDSDDCTVTGHSESPARFGGLFTKRADSFNSPVKSAAIDSDLEEGEINVVDDEESFDFNGENQENIEAKTACTTQCSLDSVVSDTSRGKIGGQNATDNKISDASQNDKSLALIPTVTDNDNSNSSTEVDCGTSTLRCERDQVHGCCGNQKTALKFCIHPKSDSPTQSENNEPGICIQGNKNVNCLDNQKMDTYLHSQKDVHTFKQNQTNEATGSHQQNTTNQDELVRLSDSHTDVSETSKIPVIVNKTGLTGTSLENQSTKTLTHAEHKMISGTSLETGTNLTMSRTEHTDLSNTSTESLINVMSKTEDTDTPDTSLESLINVMSKTEDTDTPDTSLESQTNVTSKTEDTDTPDTSLECQINVMSKTEHADTPDTSLESRTNVTSKTEDTDTSDTSLESLINVMSKTEDTDTPDTSLESQTNVTSKTEDTDTPDTSLECQINVMSKTEHADTPDTSLESQTTLMSKSEDTDIPDTSLESQTSVMSKTEDTDIPDTSLESQTNFMSKTEDTDIPDTSLESQTNLMSKTEDTDTPNTSLESQTNVTSETEDTDTPDTSLESQINVTSKTEDTDTIDTSSTES